MPLPSLLLLSALAALAAPRPSAPPAVRDAAPAALDPSLLNPQARAEWEADPEGFAREHGDEIAARQRWNTDPALGHDECRADKSGPRACMERRVGEMSELFAPRGLGVINSYIKLLPRGVTAAVPEGPGFDRRSGSPPASAAGGGAPKAPAPSNPAPKEAGFRNGAPPPTPPARQTAAPAPADGWSLDDAVDWLCSYIVCART